MSGPVQPSESQSPIGPSVAVILPALDEEGAVAAVVGPFAAHGTRVVVVDNGSRDQTAERARRGGAEVVSEPQRGYGAACLAGLAYLRTHSPPEVVVFCDCDGCGDAQELPRLLAPILTGTADLVLGRRRASEPGALLPIQQLGNRAVLALYRRLFGIRLRDPSPFRAIRWSLIERLPLSERSHGLPLEMIAQASLHGARIAEVDVQWARRKSGRSKVSGTVVGTLRAGARMAWVGFRVRLTAGDTT